MTSFCECSLCQEMRKKARNPKCSYCGKHHDSKIACPEMAGTKKKSPFEKAIERVIGNSKEIKYEKTKCPACKQMHEKGKIGCPDVLETWSCPVCKHFNGIPKEN